MHIAISEDGTSSQRSCSCASSFFSGVRRESSKFHRVNTATYRLLLLKVMDEQRTGGI